MKLISMKNINDVNPADLRKLRPGDVITAYGERSVIGEIIHQDFFIDSGYYAGQKPGNKTNVVIKYLDDLGRERNYKSWFDGGLIELND